MVHLDCLDLNPWPVRVPDVDRPDELRLDLDPEADVPFSTVRTVVLRDRTVAGAYSVRPTGFVSAPLRWGIDEAVGDLGSLLDLARRDAEGGLGDAPWPPHFPKQPDEPPRLALAPPWTGMSSLHLIHPSHIHHILGVGLLQL